MVANWVLWGLGWLFMPRMTIGILIYKLFEMEHTLGLTLAIVGAILDLGSGGSSYKK